MIPRIAPGTLLASLLVLTVSPSRGLARPASPPASPARVTSFDLSRRLDVGALNMVVTNFGSFAYDLAMGAPGLEFPRGSGKSVMFSSGLWIGSHLAFVFGRVNRPFSRSWKKTRSHIIPSSQGVQFSYPAIHFRCWDPPSSTSAVFRLTKSQAPK